MQNTQTFQYTVMFEHEADGGYHAFCPALPGCHSQWETAKEAAENGREAIELYLESLRAHNEPMPVEDILIKPIAVAVPS
jgi:predicted RNase H-like HicB family nuclease